MSTYEVTAPIVIVRFKKETDDCFSYMAWSPRRYGPAYTYEFVVEIENKNDYHPSMNVEFSEFLQRIFNHLDLDHDHLQGTVTQYGLFIDLSVDYHCPIPLERRSDTLYCTTLNHQPFSPYFFNLEQHHHYLNQQRIFYPLLRRDLQSTEIQHQFI
jgi:hypothetical protein